MCSDSSIWQMDLKPELTRGGIKGHFILIKGKSQQKYAVIQNIYASNMSTQFHKRNIISLNITSVMGSSNNQLSPVDYQAKNETEKFWS